MLKLEPTKQNIFEAHKLVKRHVHHTPMMSSKSINALLGCKIFFKCENFQKVGAFKFRGAVNAIFSLNKTEVARGVATHSSGNHAAALSLAAKMRNIPAYIVMPRTAPQNKKAAVEGYGGKIFYCEPTLQAREEMLNDIVEKTGAVFVHPYDNYSIIAGQATVAKEIYEELGALDYIIAPVGGGGLLSGTCLSTRFFSPITEVIGAEPKGADDAFRSLRDAMIHPSVNPQTVCDGLLTQLCDKTFSIISKNVSEIFTAEEGSIILAMRMIWERMKIIVEPSAAVALAVILENKDKFAGKSVGIILTGGNVDLGNLPWIEK
jgi:threonine dehydratase